MKELMLGNKAVARGLYEAGCGVISSYPQHGDHRRSRQIPGDLLRVGAQ